MTAKRQPPAAARRYMAEFEETEADFRAWLARQAQAFDGIASTSTTFAGWLAFKMGCTPRQAEQVAEWAGLMPPRR